MKRFGLLVACLLLGGLTSLQAQNAPGAGHRDHLAHMFWYLSPEQRTELMLAYQKAIEDEPDLATDTADIMKEGHQLHSAGGSPQDFEAFRVKFLGYEERLRLALVKQDGGVGTILDQVEKHLPPMMQLPSVTQ